MACLSAQCLTSRREMSECTQLFVLSETSKRGGISWPVDLATTCFHLDFKTVRDRRVRNTLVIQDKISRAHPTKTWSENDGLATSILFEFQVLHRSFQLLDDLVESSSVFTKLMTISTIEATSQKLPKQPKSAIQKQTRSCEINIYK